MTSKRTDSSGSLVDIQSHKRWDGSKWVDCTGKRWDGTGWVIFTFKIATMTISAEHKRPSGGAIADANWHIYVANPNNNPPDTEVRIETNENYNVMEIEPWTTWSSSRHELNGIQTYIKGLTADFYVDVYWRAKGQNGGASIMITDGSWYYV